MNATAKLASALVLLLSWTGATRAQRSVHFPAAKNGKAELKYVNDIPVLLVEGTPEEIGTRIGTLALKPGKRVLTYPKELLAWRDLSKLWGLFLGHWQGHVPPVPRPVQGRTGGDGQVRRQSPTATC